MSRQAFQLKTRMIYAAAVIIAIILGISSRSYSDALPDFVSRHAGDALWASMIYFGIRTLFPGKKLGHALWISLVFCFAVEFSQLYQAGWIDAIRSTVLGSLVLGHGFLFVDLIRYSVGILVSYVIDRRLRVAR